MKRIQELVSSLPKNALVQGFLDARGLYAYRVSWEDMARTKFTNLGPNITDMTLRVGERDMPIIRRRNHEDLTYDVPVERIELTVGNEHGEEKHKVSLEEYLTNLPHYLHRPLKYTGKSLFVPGRDSNVLMSAQACMLPLDTREAAKTPFVVSARNYESCAGSPAALVLVATDDGTSAHVINTSNTELLYFNKNGERCQLMAEPLGAYRRSQGRADDGSLMNVEERAKNAIMVIQIPLKQKVQPKNKGLDSDISWGGSGFGGSGLGIGFGGAGGPKKSKTWGAVKDPEHKFTFGATSTTSSQGFPPKSNVPTNTFSFGSTASDTWGFSSAPSANSGESAPSLALFSFGADPPAEKKEERAESDDMGFDLFGDGDVQRRDFTEETQPAALPKPKVENAIVSIGEPEGPFDELCGQSIERDPQYPIRVTMQYYYATTTGSVDETLVRQIDEQIRDTQKIYKAVAVGSLVVNGDTDRTTEAQPGKTQVATWWETFADTHWVQFKDFYPTRDAAADLLFKNGRFLNDVMSAVEHKALDILVKNGKKCV